MRIKKGGGGCEREKHKLMAATGRGITGRKKKIWKKAGKRAVSRLGRRGR